MKNWISTIPSSSLSSAYTLFLRHIKQILAILVICYSALNGHAQLAYIPIDHKGESPATHVGYMKNDGQLTSLQGTIVPNILYYSIQSNPQMFFSKDNEVFFLIGARDSSDATPDTLYRIGMQFIGYNVNPYVVPQTFEEHSDHWNFLLGHMRAPLYGMHASRRLVYPKIYPHIDFHAYSNPYGPKFYLVMNPGSDPSSIKMLFQGQDSLILDAYGNLKAYAKDKYVVLPRGLCYQEINGTTQLVSAALGYDYQEGQAIVGFQFGNYNPSYPLIVDISASMGAMGGGTDAEPEWATFYGHTEEDIALDGVVLVDGSLLACGKTLSPSFPLFDEQDGIFDGNAEAYFSEFDSDYKRVYTTLFGGNGFEQASSMAVSVNESAVYLFGRTTSTDLLTLQNGSGFYDDTSESDGSNLYITRFSRSSNPIGQSDWVTYFGQGLWTANCLRVDAQDNIHILGTTDSFEPPFSLGSCDGQTWGTFPLCNPTGVLDYTQGSTAGGSDAFYARFNSQLELVHSTFFGGSGSDHGRDLVIDNASNRVYFTGNTSSPNVNSATCQPNNNGGFPLCNLSGSYFQPYLNGNNSTALNDGFIVCMDGNGSLIWSTYVGSSADETGQSIGRNLNGDIYMAGLTNSTDYSSDNCIPPTDSGLPNCYSGTEVHMPRSNPQYDYYIIRFDGGTHSLGWSTFINGSVNSFRPDEAGVMNIGVTSATCSGGTLELDVIPRQNTYFQPENTDVANVKFDAMAIGLNANDELVYSTYFGGLGSDFVSRLLPWTGGRLYMIGGSYAMESFPFHCPPTDDPYCYLTYGTQSSSGEAFYAQLQYDVTIGIDNALDPNPRNGILNVYPNPSSGHFTVEWPETYQSKDVPTLEIFDGFGRLILRETVPIGNGPNSLSVELAMEHVGPCLVRVSSKEGELIGSRLIIIQ